MTLHEAKTEIQHTLLNIQKEISLILYDIQANNFAVDGVKLFKKLNELNKKIDEVRE